MTGPFLPGITSLLSFLFAVALAVGLTPEFGSSYLLWRQVGYGRALDVRAQEQRRRGLDVGEGGVERLAVRNEVEAQRRLRTGQDGVLRVLQLPGIESAGLAAQRHAVGVEVARDEFQSAAQPLGGCDDRQHPRDDREHPAFLEVALVEIALLLRGLRHLRDEGRVDAELPQRRAVEDEFVRRPVPHHDRPRAADRVEIGAGQRSNIQMSVMPVPFLKVLALTRGAALS
mgnify:CR=1 FL=1